MLTDNIGWLIYWLILPSLLTVMIINLQPDFYPLFSDMTTDEGKQSSGTLLVGSDPYDDQITVLPMEHTSGKRH